MTEGTERYPGVELIEAAERLGATLHADASWDAFAASVDVAARRLGAALELLAELVERPTFPEADVARLREERLNDLLQVKADPRRRVEQAFAATIYAPDSPYSRPAGGDEETVPRLDAATSLRQRPSRRCSIRAERRSSSAATWPGWTYRRWLEARFGSPGRRGSAAAGDVRARRRRPRRRRAERPSIGRSSASTTGPARSRPSCGSATWACRGGCRTSTRSRSWPRSWAACSTRGCR